MQQSFVLKSIEQEDWVKVYIHQYSQVRMMDGFEFNVRILSWFDISYNTLRHNKGRTIDLNYNCFHLSLLYSLIFCGHSEEYLFICFTSRVRVIDRILIWTIFVN